jgi:hypothetical protein
MGGGKAKCGGGKAKCGGILMRTTPLNAVGAKSWRSRKRRALPAHVTLGSGDGSVWMCVRDEHSLALEMCSRGTVISAQISLCTKCPE